MDGTTVLEVKKKGRVGKPGGRITVEIGNGKAFN